MNRQKFINYTRKNLKGFKNLLALSIFALALLPFAATPVQANDATITISAIPVTPPVTGVIPVTNVETAEYTGTVQWLGAPERFEANMRYMALISLTAKQGYTLTGVPENFFTVAGAVVMKINFADAGELLVEFPETGPAATTAYVTESGSGNKNGNSWENAIDGLSNALDAARANTSIKEIWVAAGTYAPQYKAGDGTSDQDKAFVLVKDVKIYGGFAGTETSVAERNPVQNPTFLSGELSGSISSYHVVISSGEAGAARLDGFIIKSGKATGQSSYIKVNGLDIHQGSGGGIFCNHSSPALANIFIVGNNAVYEGGGIYMCGGAAPAIDNALIIGNVASTGGGIFLDGNSVPVMTNITVTENMALGIGGGISNHASSGVRLYNSIIWYNSAPDYSNMEEHHNLISENGINCSLVEGWDLTSSGTGNLNGALPANDPKFTDRIHSDYTLQPVSPCVDAGNNDYNTAATDLAWNPRVFNGRIDMGAYECVAVVAPAITTNSLLDGTVDAAYSKTLIATGGAITWSIESGSLPDGLTLSPGGVISGTPTVAGTFNFTVKAANSIGYATQALSITILVHTADIYVTESGSGSRNGNSWENAMEGLSNALEAARADASIKEIWVAAGTYTPQHKLANTDVNGTPTTDLDKTFRLVKDVKIYGGFAGTETGLSQRNPAQNVTVLSGNLGSNVKVRHVVIAVGNVGAARLDGFTIMDGNSTGTTWVRVTTDGADYDNFQGNGGGIFCNRSAPQFANLIIKNNSATSGGGAFLCGNAAPEFTNVLVVDNSATAICGGIYFNEQAAPVFTNITVAANTSSSDGSGIYNDADTRTKLQNSIVWNNSMRERSGSFGGNISYSLVQTISLSGTGNLDGALPANDPQFVNASAGDYRLQLTSPCINVGSNDFNACATDLAWNPRIAGTAIDMGAYEAANTNAIETSVLTDELRILIDNGYLKIVNYTGGDIAIYNVTGQAAPLKSLLSLTTTKTIDISALPSGVYIVKAGNKTGKFVKK